MANSSKTGTGNRPLVDNAGVSTVISSIQPNSMHSQSANRPIHSTSNISNATAPKSFSRAVKSFPKKNQALTYQALPDTKLKDYLIATAKLTGDKAIVAASRISNNRICLYLDSKNSLDLFMDKHGSITLGTEIVPARRMVAPTKKITLSNVHPCLPDDLIIEALKLSKLQPTSSINVLHVRVGECEEFDFNHVQTFRRFLYIVDDGKTILPDSILIKHENENFRIFVADADLRCYLCKEFGHIASTCDQSMDTYDENSVDAQVDQDDNHHSTPSTAQNPLTDNCSDPTFNPQQLDRDFPPLGNPSQKRTLSSTASELSSAPLNPPASIQEGKTGENPVKKKKKKQKTETDPISTQQLLIPIRENYETKRKDGIYSLSFSNFSLLIDGTKGLQNPSTELPNFNTSTEEITKIIEDNYPFLKHRTMKHRFTRLKNKLAGRDSAVSDSESAFSS